MKRLTRNDLTVGQKLFWLYYDLEKKKFKILFCHVKKIGRDNVELHRGQHCVLPSFHLLDRNNESVNVPIMPHSGGELRYDYAFFDEDRGGFFLSETPEEVIEKSISFRKAEKQELLEEISRLDNIISQMESLKAELDT